MPTTFFSIIYGAYSNPSGVRSAVIVMPQTKFIMIIASAKLITQNAEKPVRSII
jgi:hypothetical protein